MRTAELTGALLDYWVARAEGASINNQGRAIMPNATVEEHALYVCPYTTQRTFSPCMYWAQGGPIIEREKLELTPLYDMGNRFVYWASQPRGLGHLHMEDEQPLVAAMRAYVASKFGDEVED